MFVLCNAIDSINDIFQVSKTEESILLQIIQNLTYFISCWLSRQGN